MVGHTEAELEQAVPAVLSKWITTAKRFFTISAKDVDVKLANLAKLQTSQVFQTDLQESMVKLRERYETLSVYYIHLEEKSDPAVFKENYLVHITKLEKTKEEKEQAYSTAMASARQMMDQVRTEAGQSREHGSSGAGPSSYKIEASFKPKKDLSDEFNLTEFKNWLEEFWAYHEISKLSKASDEIQKMVLKSCCSSDFLSKLDLSHAIDVRDCIKIMEESFKKANPRLLMRHRYLKLCQDKGEEVSEFMAKEAKLARDAGIAEITPEELRAHVLMAGMQEKELVKKLLEVKEEDLSVAKIKEVSEIYTEQTKTVDGLVKRSGAKVARVDGENSEDSSKSVTCWTCGGSGHRSPECKIPPSQLHCDHCAKHKLKANKHNTNSYCLRQLQKRATKKDAKNQQAKAEEKTKEEKKEEKEADGRRARATTPDDHPDGDGDSCDEDSREDEDAAHFASARVARARARVKIAGARVRSRARSRAEQKEVEEEVERSAQAKCMVCSATPNKSLPTPTVGLFVSGAGPSMRNAPEVTSVPDTGCTMSCLKLRLANKLKLKLRKTDIALTGANGASLAVEGEVDIYCKVKGGKVKKITCLVSSDLKDNILISWHNQKDLQILSPEWPELPKSLRLQEEEGAANNRKLNSHEVGQFDKVDDKDIKSLLTEFDDVFHDELEEDDRLADVEVDIKLKEGSEPYKTNRTQRLDYHELQPAWCAVKKALEGGWLREHDPKKDKPIEWLFCGQLLQKPNCDPANPTYRIVADFGPLNDRVEKEHYAFKSPEELWRKVKPSSKLYFVMDATASFSQCKLSAAAQDIMVISLMTPDGVKYYHLNSCGQGFCNSGPTFCKFSDQILDGTPMEKGIDDVLVQGDDKDEVLRNLRQVLEAARKGKLTFSRKKIQYGQSVEFCGFKLTNEGMQPLPRKVLAIQNHPVPQNSDHLRSFLGLLGQFSKFWPDLSHVAQPLRRLLKKGEEWNWGPVETEQFEKIKSMMTDHMNLVAYDPEKLTKLQHDACCTGLGFVLSQFHEEEICWCKDKAVSKKDRQKSGAYNLKCFCRWRILWCGSRALKPSYRSLPATWLECIGHHWAIKECSFYLKMTKKKFIAETDHLSLVTMAQKPLEELPEKLRDLFIDLRCYNYFTVFNPGLKMEISDTLSRSVHWSPDKEEEEAEQDEADRRVLHEALARQVLGATVSDYIWRDPLLKPIIDQSAKDPEFKIVLDLLKSEGGRVKGNLKKKLPSEHPARPYLGVWDRLGWQQCHETGAEFMTLDGTKIVIPRGVDEITGQVDGHLRKKICANLHIPHAGEKKTIKAGTKRYFWPNIREQLSKVCQDCDICVETSRQQAAEPPPHKEDLSSYPMEKLSTDLFHFRGKTFLILIDWFSGYPFVKDLGRSSSTEKVIKKMRKIFLEQGFPRTLKADYGPEYRLAFGRWCKDAGIELIHSSAGNSPGNARAERGVGQMKKLMERAHLGKQDWLLSLSEWRNCPTVDGPSPAQLFFGRSVRSMILPELLQEVDKDADRDRRRNQEEINREKRVTKAPLEMLKRNQKVWLRNKATGRWDIPGRIRGARPHGRSFVVETRTGGLYLRNRKFIKPRRTGEGEEGGCQNILEEECGEVTDKVDSSQECGEAIDQEDSQERGKMSLTEQEPTYAEVVSGVITRSRAKKLKNLQ